MTNPKLKPYLKASYLSDDELLEAKKADPKNSVFLDLLQAFALMRSAAIEQKQVQEKIKNLLVQAVATFDDLRDPVNFSMAFSADEDKDFRGRPHERMYAAAMTAIFFMAEGKCDMAMPYLRNAEFLDARFRKMSLIRTDAPLIYAAQLFCLKNGDESERTRAKDGIIRSVRFLSLQEDIIKALVDVASVDIRPFAIANRLAYMLMEVSLYQSLLSAPNDASIAEIIDDAAKNAELFAASLDTSFEDDFKARMEPMLAELAQIYGLKEKKGSELLKELALGRVGLDVKNIAESIKKLSHDLPQVKTALNAAMTKSKRLSTEILAAVDKNKLILNFTGEGPKLIREGSYDEISVIKPGPDAAPSPDIRERKIVSKTGCGFHRSTDGGFSAVLCKDQSLSEGSDIAALPSLEVLSLSRKASTVQGRHFDKVLQGRAQFRAATEEIATVSAWSALFLFVMGTAMIDACNKRGASQSCYAPGLVMYALGGITIIFSGTVWLIGKSKNPAADSRFIHLMYESTWLAI